MFEKALAGRKAGRSGTLWRVLAAGLSVGLLSGPVQAAGTRLEIDSEPSGATVLLNGRLAGATPLVVQGLTLGVYGLRLEKAGCQPVSRMVELKSSQAKVREKLEPLPTGALHIDIQPHGAEVLLGGELLGNTPLYCDQVTAGVHELVIRKTNFETYSRRVELRPGQTLKFAGFELKDRIETMLLDLIRAEPLRVNHYTDLAHYYFVNGKMEQAAATFARGFEKLFLPLETDRPGMEKMTAEEIAQEHRLRAEDTKRFWGEMRKHRALNRREANVFRTELDRQIEALSQKNVASWDWVEGLARSYMKENPEKAAVIYQNHIAAAPDAPTAASAYLALVDVYVQQKDAAKIAETGEHLLNFARDNPGLLRSGAERLVEEYAKLRKDPRVITVAEKLLRRALVLETQAAAKADCQYNLGVVLVCQGREREAVKLFKEAVDGSADPQVREERACLLAETLVQLGRVAAAREVYEPLRASKNSRIANRARSALRKLDGAKE